MVEKLYVVDTHTLIWYFTGNSRLPERQKALIDTVRNQGGRLLIPTIVLAEALNIAEKNRVIYDFDAMYRIIQAEAEFEIVAFTNEIFATAIQVKDQDGIHDRLIVATAKFYAAGMLTKDRVIRSSGQVDIL